MTNILLWIGQIALAVIFVVSGTFKVTMPKQKLIESGQTGVAPFPLPAIRAIATCELVGAVGIVAPWALDIAPVLTPLAAVGFVLLMIGAAISHTRLREPRNVAVNATILVLALAVAIGRFAGL